MKRKHEAVGALGLGGYASDDDDDSCSQEQEPEDNGKGNLNDEQRPGITVARRLQALYSVKGFAFLPQARFCPTTEVGSPWTLQILTETHRESPMQ